MGATATVSIEMNPGFNTPTSQTQKVYLGVGEVQWPVPFFIDKNPNKIRSESWRFNVSTQEGGTWSSTIRPCKFNPDAVGSVEQLIVSESGWTIAGSSCAGPWDGERTTDIDPLLFGHQDL